MVRPLVNYEEYNRREVHDIFDPESNFTPGAGLWGLSGTIKIPNREKDYVFFVTFGQSQAHHTFDEEVTDDGILVWQSQPSRDFASSQIIDLISHNHEISNIYLFLRTDKYRDYTYLGRLAYVSHDSEREKPVHFIWQILDWDLPMEKSQEIGLRLTDSTFNDSNETVSEELGANTLLLTSPPSNTRRRRSTREFQGKHVDFAENNARNKKLGFSGEELVVEYEKRFLIENGRSDLAEQVLHVAKIEGDGAGYDVLSYDPDGSKKYIEVKTTKGGPGTPFYLSLNELHFSALHSSSYFLYRIYKFDSQKRNGSLYILQGNLEGIGKLDIQPVQFKVGFYRTDES